MRKYFLLAAGIVLTTIFAISCSQESLPGDSSSNEAVVSLGITLPGSPATRAYSDGYSAKNLYYAVYEAGNSNLATQGTTTFPEGSLETTVNITLIKGVTYKLAFWAQASDAPYTFSAADQTVTVDYDSATCNDESRDAFYNVVEYTPTASTGTLDVELYRPFAQINFLTSDFTADAVQDFVANMQSSIAIDGYAYTSLDLLSGDASDYQNVTFASATIPSGEASPVSGYQYVAMTYVLVGASASESSDVFNTVTLNATSTNTAGTSMNVDVPVSNVPVQRNYRTNIYGALLTESTVVNVEIKPAYEGDYPIAYPVTVSASDSEGNALEFADNAATVNVEAATESYSFDITVDETTSWTVTADNANAELSSSTVSTTALTKADETETTLPSISGTGPATITVTFPANESTEATVTTNVSIVAEGAETLTIAIIQAAAEAGDTEETTYAELAKDTDAKTITITDPSATASGSSITYAFADAGAGNGEAVPEITLEDGTTISFAQNEGNNPPLYYTSGTAVRMYALNSMIVTGSSAIAEIVVTYTGSYYGNDELYATVDGNTWEVVNYLSTGTSGGTQLRIVSITITYAGEAGEGGEEGDAPETTGDGTVENPYTVADALAIINAGTYTEDNVYVKGKVSHLYLLYTVSGISRMRYYISDDGSETDQLYVYNGLNLGGGNFFSLYDLSVGDDLIICGALTLYTSYSGTTTPEIAENNYLYSFNGVTDYLYTSATSVNVTADEGTTSFTITSSVDYTVSSSDDTNFATFVVDGTVTVSYTANSGEARSATITVTPTSSTAVSAAEVVITQDAPESTGGDDTETTGDGTVDNPYTVAQALEIINAGTYTSDNVYVAGTISQIDDIDTGSFGNATYYISDDGTTSSQLEIYRGYSLSGAKFTYDDEIAVGDNVVVCGVLTLYSSSIAEMNSGSSIITLNGSSELTGDHLTLSETTLSASSGDAGSVTFDITSNTSWTVASDNTDFTVNPASGSGNATVTVSYTANEGSSSRTAIITVSYGEKTKTATITQISSSAKIITWENVGSSYQTWESATHETYGDGYSATSDGMTVSYYKHESSSSIRAADSDHIRVYKSSELVISLADTEATITSVVLYTTSSSYCYDMTVSDGSTATADTTEKTVSWSGSLTSFEAQATGGQNRINKIVVTYE